MTPEALYLNLGRLIAEMPEFSREGAIPDDTNRWLGRAIALIELSGSATDHMQIKVAAQNLNSSIRYGNVQTIKAILFNALARAELTAPANAQGAFIPTGNTFDAFVAVGKVLQSATTDLLIVDPYADEKLLTDFAVQANLGVRVNVLADAAGKKGTLKPAAERWHVQFADRPLEIRIAPALSLHDRLIIVDQTSVWTLGQSMNAMAARAPTSIVRVYDSETVRLKLDAYASIWSSAAPLA